MKRIITFTDKEKDIFYNMHAFLNKIANELDDMLALTNERENIIDNAHKAIEDVVGMFDNDEG